jgi:ABC-type oligopeptide transport system ATPase subunit
MMNGNGATLIAIAGVAVHFPVRRSWVDVVGRAPRQLVRAVDGVDLAIGDRETLGLVGESGSGKTTLARTLVRIYEPTAGTIRLKGRALASYPRLGDDGLCRQIQMVFQDPYSRQPAQDRRRGVAKCCCPSDLRPPSAGRRTRLLRGRPAEAPSPRRAPQWRPAPARRLGAHWRKPHSSC